LKAGPSRKSAIGSVTRKAIAVTIANVFPASIFSPFGCVEVFLVSTPRREKATLEPMAKAKQSQVKLRSAAEAMATPATTGIKQAFTCQGRTSPMKMAPKTTLKKGSKDLTTLTKASEPAPSESTVTLCPSPWIAAMGASVSRLDELRRGAFLRPRSHSGPT